MPGDITRKMIDKELPASMILYQKLVILKSKLKL